MSLTRRTFLYAICLLPYFPKVGLALPTDWAALAKEDTNAPEIPPEYAMFRDQPSLNDESSFISSQPTGKDPALKEEELRANEVISNAPTNCRPIDVALFYLSVGQGALGKEYIPYITAWPVRWNPVIVNFFNATATKPRGDTTAWCAAFVNYCLKRARDKPNEIPGTRSAGSRTFRNWGKETKDPKPGDIVVFINKNDKEHGHVGFFLAEQGDKILVLGGNQFEGTPVRHTINRKLISKNSSVLEFHSYRTEERLHV